MTEPRTTVSKIATLSPTEYANQTSPPLLIDVRSALEYRLMHPAQAINLSLLRLLLGTLPTLRRWAWPHWFQTLSPEQPVAVICLTAHRSPIAASCLERLGFSTISNISGGLIEWNRMGLSTCKGTKASPD
ncbi:rhodanese-like domain-containing protein [Acaryochloris thomasi]|uniref:rhodanese-like domain-containing protein n=1 Tax=Acaryochloris thomasi TaxID=2929456 RepID=UPI000DA642B8|nr:rhodanese-like domain-containing protein [Acaryochloris thomasi]